MDEEERLRGGRWSNDREGSESRLKSRDTQPSSLGERREVDISVDGQAPAV